MTDPNRAARPASESELVAHAAEGFRAQGYRTYIDPDGTDYFDLVVRRDGEVGLVEAKLTGTRAVLLQAVRRRAWGDWVAIVLPSRRAAERAVDRTADRRAAPVGVFAWQDGQLTTIRPPGRFPAAVDDPFASVRAQLAAALDRLDAGELPANVPWDGVGVALRRASGGRRFREWRLDEPPAGPI